MKWDRSQFSVINQRLILKGKAWLWAVYANMELSGSWNVNALWTGFSEISKWTWRTVSEEITTKELPVCRGDLHWGTAGPSAIPGWALRQVSRRFAKASSKAAIVMSRDVYCRTEYKEVGQLFHSLNSPTSVWLLLEKSLDHKVQREERWERTLRDPGTVYSNCTAFFQMCLVYVASWNITSVHRL